MPDQPDLWSPGRAPKAAYEIDVRVDLARAALEGTQTVSLRNDSSECIRALRVLWNDGSECGLEVGSSGRLVASGENAMALRLEEPVGPGDRVELRMAFRGPVEVLGWHPRLDWGGPPTFDRYRVRVETNGDPLVIATGRLQGKTTSTRRTARRVSASWFVKGSTSFEKTSTAFSSKSPTPRRPRRGRATSSTRRLTRSASIPDGRASTPRPPSGSFPPSTRSGAAVHSLRGSSSSTAQSGSRRLRSITGPT